MPLISDLLGPDRKRILRPSGGCHSCPRQKVDFVPASLRDTKLLILGEAPGAEEVKRGEGFVGASGQLLRSTLEKYGITKYSLSNTIHCRPPGKAQPSTKEISCCLSQFVLDEIRGYPLVVLAGGVPLQAIFPGASAPKFRGNVTWHADFPGQRFYPIYHPAFLLRKKDMMGEWEKQVARLARLYHGEPPQPWEVIQGGGERFQTALRTALASPLVSLDLEANRLESWKVDSRIRSLALTADGKEVLFVHEQEPHFLGTLEAVRTYLEKPEKHVVGMNTGFDLQWLEEELGFRCRCTGIHDVATIWYEVGQYKMPSLKELVAKELDGYRHLIPHPDLEQDLHRLALYNSEDVVYSLELFRKGMALAKPKTRELLVRVSGASGYVLRQITSNGFPLRVEYWKKMVEEYREKPREILEAWRKDDPEFIPTLHHSGKGLQEYLFKIKGLPVVKRSPNSGEPSTDETAVKEWLWPGTAPYLTHLLALRGVEKIRSTYLEPYSKWVVESGRIHASFTNTFTDSGRSSSRDPNLQNIPRIKAIRDLFGGPLLEADLSQIEFRIMVCLAQDPGGIQAYQEGLDAHTLTAKSFAKGPVPTKEERTWAKVVNFALIFGGDAYKVRQWARDQYGLSWTEREAQRFVDTFFETYPTFLPYHQQAEQELRDNRGWFESVTGHLFHYRDWDHSDQKKRDHAFRAHLNARAQGPAAQICFYIMILADRLLVEREIPVKMVNTVHDSVLFELPSPSLVGEVVATLEEAKELAYQWVKPWFVVPLVMDYKVGPSWGSLGDWEPRGNRA